MRITVATAALLLALVLPSPEAAACSCVFRGISTVFRESTVVVTAKAVSASTTIEKVATSSPDEDYEAEVQTVVWEVQESFKGPHKSRGTFTTTTEVTCCMCGMSAVLGETYILYMYGKEPYGLSDCSGSSLLQNSLKDIATLRRLSRRVRNGT